jgi:uncharacterized membrane protein
MNERNEEHGFKTEEAISTLLKVGVNTSLVLIAAGTLLSFLNKGGYEAGAPAVAKLTTSAGAFPRTVHWLAAGIVHGNGQALIILGLLLLIMTPVLRVALSILGFALERDRAFVVITTVVLLLLLISFWLGKGA